MFILWSFLQGQERHGFSHRCQRVLGRVLRKTQPEVHDYGSVLRRWRLRGADQERERSVSFTEFHTLPWNRKWFYFLESWVITFRREIQQSRLFGWGSSKDGNAWSPGWFHFQLLVHACPDEHREDCLRILPPGFITVSFTHVHPWNA